MSIPKDKSYPVDSVQCDNCGGYGCLLCNDRGWFTPQSHPKGRRCEEESCDNPIPPSQAAVYCSDQCAMDDA